MSTTIPHDTGLGTIQEWEIILSDTLFYILRIDASPVLSRSGLSRATSFGSLRNAMNNIDGTNDETREGGAPLVHDDDEEEFHYPITEDEDTQQRSAKVESEAEEDTEEFNYPVSPLQQAQEQYLPAVSPPRETFATRPSPGQLENIYAAALSGDLALLQKFFSNATSQKDIEPFALANDAAPRTGLTAIHASASRGHVNVLRWRKYTHLTSCSF